MKLIFSLITLFSLPFAGLAAELDCATPSDPNRFAVSLSVFGGSLAKLEVKMGEKIDHFNTKKAVFDVIVSDDYKAISIVAGSAGERGNAGSFFHLVALPNTVTVEESNEGTLVKFSAKTSYDGELGVYLDDEAVNCTLLETLF